MELGKYGMWKRTPDVTPELAKEAERLGYGAIWMGGSPPGHLEEVERILEATESIPVVTGIINMWRADADTVAQAYHRVTDRHLDRFLLGLGIGHPESVKDYRRPLQVMGDYLDVLDQAGVPRERVVLAALGPKALTLSAERTAGAHPYLTTPRHTKEARRVMGEGPLLAPEQKVVLHSDPAEALALGRSEVSRYLRLVNYRTNLLREGWGDADVSGDGSDRLVDELCLHGTAEEVAAGIRGHVEAGADHVGIQVLGDQPLQGYRALAEVLLG